MKQAVWDLDAVLQRHGVLLLKLWLQAAKNSGITKEESRKVLEKATENDYIQLVATLQKYTKPPENSLAKQNFSLTTLKK